MKYSNCNLFAWREFLHGRAEVMTLRKTQYSKLAQAAQSPWWRFFLRPVGYLLGYPSWISVQLSWVLMFGRWAHVTWSDGRQELEFVPVVDRTERVVPPWLFRGVVRPYEGDTGD